MKSVGETKKQPLGIMAADEGCVHCLITLHTPLTHGELARSTRIVHRHEIEVSCHQTIEVIAVNASFSKEAASDESCNSSYV